MLIYKICHRNEWAQAQRQGVYAGSAKDREDGFIHFSKAGQVAQTLARYYDGESNLVLLAADANRLAYNLKFEPSRGGELFPHFYGTLPLSSVTWVKPIGVKLDGSFILPEECV
ncbi:MAG TPA: DUF952 domain-containing protein [Rhizomicrobium sp.]|nr:DUF952 domain-containing protein [Rhizomicrobium sp.]